MNIICLGDSNTYGYDPRSWLGERYAPDSCWVNILAGKTGWRVYNWGENGREIPITMPALPANTDLLILMLGTNDLLQGCSPEIAAKKLEHLLSTLPLCPHRILLISPPAMALGEWVASQALVDDSQTFARCCQSLARRLGIHFADAGKWDIPLAHDGVHFTEQGHRTFADGLLQAIRCTVWPNWEPGG